MLHNDDLRGISTPKFSTRHWVGLCWALVAAYR